MPVRKYNIPDEEDQKPLFHDSLDCLKLPMNNNLPPIKLNSISEKQPGCTLQINFTVPELNKLINVYLFVGGKKKDMFYQLPSGNYNFKLKENADQIELFYVAGNFRSPSVFSFIKG